jgi:phosphatidylglycerol---prolipoprotein diacylglyceryl transferase
MYPELGQIGPWSLRSYSLITELGIIIGIIAAYKAARRQGMNADTFIDLAICAVVGGIVGSRLHYVVVAWEQERYWEEPIRVLFSWEGGLVFQGAIVGGLLGMLVFIWRRRLPFLSVADLGAVGLPLGHFVGRFACLLNGCCYGQPTTLPWGIVFPFLDHAVHPTMVYEALANLGIFAVLWRVDRRKPYPGYTLGLYLIAYSTVRFFVEFWRGDPTQYFLMLRQAQWMSLGLLLAGAMLLAYLSRVRKGRAAPSSTITAADR